MINSLLDETKIVHSISFDQHEIILDIMQLHCSHGIELDPNYGEGGFYKHSGIRKPKYCYDINPRDSRCLQGDCRQLPLAAGSIRSIIFDPPFMVTGRKSAEDWVMSRYSYVEKMADLHSLYEDSFKEFYRLLLPQGILIFKCMDAVSGCRNYFTHVWVMNKAEEIGYRAIDLFIKLNKSVPICWNMKKQHHARKHHCYFWIFKK